MITPALLETLPEDELEAVLAHEAGHVRHGHLPLYLAFLGGYMVLALALAGLLWKLMISWTAAADWVAGLDQDGLSLDTVVIMLPMLVWLVVYFRFVFGFFMRNFERQADLFAAALVGAEPLIRAFNRIAAVSGMNPKTPSWHHFSIYRRVRTLSRFSVDPELIKRHAAMLKRSMIAYAGLIALVVIVGWPGGLFSNLGAVSLEKALTELDEFIQTHPGDPAPFLYKAQILLRLDRQKEALTAYNQAPSPRPGQRRRPERLGLDHGRRPRRAARLPDRPAPGPKGGRHLARRGHSGHPGRGLFQKRPDRPGRRRGRSRSPGRPGKPGLLPGTTGQIPPSPRSTRQAGPLTGGLMEPRPTTARADRAGGWNPGAIIGWLVGLGPLVFRPGLVAPLHRPPDRLVLLRPWPGPPS